MIEVDKFKCYGKTKDPQPNLINSNNMIDARYSHCPALSPCPKHLMFSGLLSDNERTYGHSGPFSFREQVQIHRTIKSQVNYQQKKSKQTTTMTMTMTKILKIPPLLILQENRYQK